MRIVTIIAGFICWSFALAAEVSPKPPFTIGVLYWSMAIPGQVAMRQGLEQETELINRKAAAAGIRGIRLIPRVAGDGALGIENQIKQMYELIEQKPDLLIVQPTDNAALAEPLQAANRLGIPVIAYDQYISGGTLKAYITSDNYQAGYLDGEYTASSFAGDKQLNIVMVEYPHVSSTVERVNGFLDALHDANVNYRIIKTYEAVEPIAGKAAGKAILRDFPAKNSIDVIFCINDGGGLPVAATLTAAGRNEIFMATVDGDPEAIKIIRKNGIIRIDSAQFCASLGQEAMRLAWKHLNGGAIPSHALVPVFPITAKTINNYCPLLEEMPEKFIKPWPSRSPAWLNNLKILK